jgi:hypothetical protein
MIRFVAVFLLIIPFLSAQDKQNILSHPVSVIWNTPFELSLITSTKYPEADRLELIISPDKGIELNSITLNTFYGSSDIEIIRDYPDYRALIDIRSNSLARDMNYQVLFSISPDDIDKAVIRISGGYYKDNTFLGELEEDGNRLIAGIEFYKPKKYAGKAIQLPEAEGIHFLISKLQGNRLTADFWFRTSEKDFSLLRVFSKEETLSELFINSFGMLSLQSNFQNKLLYPYFISQNTWNHFLIYSDFEEGKYEFYCNGNLVSSSIIDVHFQPEKLKFSFGGTDSKEYFLDQLKFSGADENGILRIMEGRYHNSPPDNISLMRIYRFDNENMNRISGDLTVEYDNIKFVRSDAPLTLRAPELNINLLSSSFELEWNEGDFRQAQQYVLERSDNNRDFTPIYLVTAENNPEAKYRYLDKKLRSSEIIYYRVKQVLKDGSAVYSSQVKVGQGISETFILAQNFPNPFNPRTSIDIELFRDSDLQVLIFNLEGKEVARLFDGNLSRGKHKFSFDGSELPSGVYICRVNTPDFSQTSKMILTK